MSGDQGNHPEELELKGMLCVGQFWIGNMVVKTTNYMVMNNNSEPDTANEMNRTADSLYPLGSFILFPSSSSNLFLSSTPVPLSQNTKLSYIYVSNHAIITS